MSQGYAEPVRPSVLQRRAVLIATRVTMLDVLQARRNASIRMLVTAVAEMVAELDPDHERDHRSLYELTGRERARKPDIFDRVRYASDELAVIGTQLAAWRGGKGPEGDDYSAATVAFGRLVEREAGPLESLERDVPAIQLQRCRHPSLRAAALPLAVRRLRDEHERACAVLALLEELA